jgi:molybdate transport system substrate-binding protein
VLNGEAAMALQPISELKAVHDVLFVGPLPAEVQTYTIYGGAIPAKARRPAAGKALLAYLRTEAAGKALVARGLERP